MIHLRLRVDWHDERKALLSYLKRPKNIEHLGNAVTVNCADYKGFRNVVLTVQGKDVPGRYKQVFQKGLQREMKLYKLIMKATMKEQTMDIVRYVNPSTSLCIFVAWMHCVYSNSMSYVPVYFVAGIIASLLTNYVKYGVDEEFNFGFTPITIKETAQVLLFGGPKTRYIKPLSVRRFDPARTARGSQDEPDDEDSWQKSQRDVFYKGGGFRMDGDHMEFPFSEAGRYSKKTLAEACVDASAMFLEDEDEDPQSPGRFSSIKRKGRKIITAYNNSDDEDEGEGEFGLMVNASLTGSHGNPIESLNSMKSTQANNSRPDQAWKRVTDTRGLPEQDPTVFVKARKTIKEDIIHNKDLMHKMSMRLFDDRLFILNEDDPGVSGQEAAHNQAIGTNKYKSPIMSKIAEYGAPALEMLKVGLSVWRVVFNLFTWRDSYLTSLFLFGAILLLCVLIVFPWRLLFFVVGFGAVGPQNWLVRLYVKKHPKEKKSKAKPKAAERKVKGKNLKHFQFHNHLLTDQGIDVREGKANKSTSSVHRAVVPNSPLISRRFYDWPPNPSLSKVRVYDENAGERSFDRQTMY